MFQKGNKVYTLLLKEKRTIIGRQSNHVIMTYQISSRTVVVTGGNVAALRGHLAVSADICGCHLWLKWKVALDI